MRMVRIELHYDGVVVRAEVEQSAASVRGMGRLPHPDPGGSSVGAGRTTDVIAAMVRENSQITTALYDLFKAADAKTPGLFPAVMPAYPEYGPFEDKSPTPHPDPTANTAIRNVERAHKR